MRRGARLSRYQYHDHVSLVTTCTCYNLHVIVVCTRSRTNTLHATRLTVVCISTRRVMIRARWQMLRTRSRLNKESLFASCMGCAFRLTRGGRARAAGGRVGAERGVPLPDHGNGPISAHGSTTTVDTEGLASRSTEESTRCANPTHPQASNIG
jgi:hypothetical protein